MEKLKLELQQTGLFEAGAKLLGLLFFPAPAEAALREGFVTAQCFQAYRAKAQRDAAWASTGQIIKPAHAFLSDSELLAAQRTLNRRQRDREVAGRMGIAFLHEQKWGKAPALPSGLAKLTVSALAEYHLRMSGEAEPINVVKRAWSQSKPVLHLATALELYQRAAPDQHRPGQPLDVMHRLDALQEVVALAAENRRLLAQAPQLGLKEASMIAVSLSD